MYNPGIFLLFLSKSAAILTCACRAQQAYGISCVFSKSTTFMQEMSTAGSNEFVAEELADDVILDGQTSTFGSLLQHFSEDIHFRRTVLGYTVVTVQTSKINHGYMFAQ